MDASLCNACKIKVLAGCNVLTILYKLLRELIRDLVKPAFVFYAKAKYTSEVKIHLDKRSFRWLHYKDSAALEKLSNAVCKLATCEVKLEWTLTEVKCGAENRKRCSA